MRWENSLMSYEEDIKNRGFWDWVKAHTSGFKPLHRYEGIFEFTEEEITFGGMDTRLVKEFHLEILLREILDIYYGFDEVFKGREERAWPWNKPLRIKYKINDEVKTIYLFVHFYHKKWIRTSDNKEVYEKLKEILRK